MKNKTLLRSLSMCVLLCGMAAGVSSRAAEVTGEHKTDCKTCVISLDSKKTINTFDGLGALVSYGKLLYDYPEQQRNEIMDYLFLPGFGANLQILKIELGYGGNNTAMAWPSYRREIDEKPVFDRGYGVWYMKEAKKRNPDIILSALHWGYPAWAVTDDLKADFVADYVIGLYKEHNLHIDYIGGNQNESKITPAVTKMIRKKLDAAGLEDVKIICADEGARVMKFKVLDSLAKDKEYADAVDVIGIHYKSRPTSFMVKNAENAYKFGKHIWSSEDGGGGFAGKASGKTWVNQIIRLLYDTEFNAIIRWLATASIYDNMPWPNNGIMKTKEPWSGHYEIGTNVWGFAHFTQFTKPGWMILDTDSYLAYDNGKGSGRYIAFSDSETGDFSVIATTYGYNDENGIDVKIKTDEKLKNGFVQVWKSHFESENQILIKERKVYPDTEGCFNIHLDKDYVYTITTTRGHGKGVTNIPVASVFPLPYEDNFESYRNGGMARYFVDADATFEIAEIDGNKVLRQVLRDKPMLWHPGNHVAQPVSEMGDMQWKDYSVQIDVMLENEGSVALCGRLDPVNEGSEKYKLQGNWLYLNDKGKWKLTSRDDENEIVRASGNIEYGIGQWTALRLDMKGDKVFAYISGKKVAEIENNYPDGGNIAIATLAPDADGFFSHTEKYTTALYDNLKIVGL